MHLLYSIYALDIASDRVREASDDRVAALAKAGAVERPSILRRGLAYGLAAVSRGSAAATRRLDEGVADDLGRSLAAAK